MSEAMTVETLAEAEWLLLNYWTRVRHPFQTPKGGWSDVDVLAYDPETKHLVIAESKVRGGKTAVFGYSEDSHRKRGAFSTWDNNDYLSFLRHVPLLCRDGIPFAHFGEQVHRLTVQLISNYAISRSLMEDAKASALALIPFDPQPAFEVSIQLDSTIDVIARIIELQHSSTQGKRYGHPVIDLVREINRFLHPELRFAGRDQAALKELKVQSIERFLGAVTADH